MRRSFFHILIAFLLLQAPHTVQAQQRGFMAVPVKERSGTRNVTLYKRSYALVIGIDAYENWPVLGKAVEDAEAVADVLKSRGFKVELKRNLRGAELHRAFESFIARYGHDKEARLFIWYAGHGHTLDGEGYLVPADGKLTTDEWGFVNSSLSLRRFGEYMRKIRSKHVLAVFDSCFAGTVFQVGRSAPRPYNYRRIKRPVRQYISSGDADQEVSDDGLFRSLFIDALNGEEERADVDQDGFLTGEELGFFLSKKLPALKRLQTPRYGKLAHRGLDRGDFVFRIPGSEPDPKPVEVKPDPQIERIQQLLTSLGYDAGPADGLMGDKTRSAIRSYQQRVGLPADGEISIGLVFRLSDDVRGQKSPQKRDKQKLALARPLKPKTPETPVKPVVGVYPKQGSRLTPGTIFDDCDGAGWCPSMVVVPKGSFMMGSNDGAGNEKPVHRVTIGEPFAVGRFEVTWDEWEACVKDGGCDKAGSDEGWGKGKRPVINVSWNDAKSYLKWLGKKTGKPYRLLSEAEWEYVARAKSTSKYSWGNGIGRNKANCDGCGSKWDNKKTAPVGSFDPNGFKVHDMHGNVWEWVEDCYKGSYKGAPTDGSANATSNCGLRVLRGGSWYIYPRNLRSADRVGGWPGNRNNVDGFRVARSLPSPRTR